METDSMKKASMVLRKFWKRLKSTGKLHGMVERMEIEKLEKALRRTKNVDALDDKGETALQVACKLGTYSPAWQVREIIRDERAFIQRKEQLVKMLLEAGADPNRPFPIGPSKKQEMPLWMACKDRLGGEDVAALLFIHGANIHLETEDGWNALAFARKTGKLALVEFLLKYGAQENEISLGIKQKDEEEAAFAKALRPDGELRVPKTMPANLENYTMIGYALRAVVTLVLKGFRLQQMKINVGQLSILLGTDVDNEVHNGGFHQFFFNSTGNYAEASVKALQQIGAPMKAKLLDLAIAQFPGGRCPEDRQKRWESMDAIDEKASPIWHELDTAYYGTAEDVSKLCEAYVQRHPEQFYLD
jgi:hypothetical protein